MADETEYRMKNEGHISAEIGKSSFYGSEMKMNWICARHNLEDNIDDPEAMMILGIIYQMGLGVKSDLQKAYAYYRKSSAMGNAEAMFRLGNMYMNGIYVRKNEYEANKLINKALISGFDPKMKQI